MRALLLCLLAVSFLFIACKKEPGEGGRAEIRGRVIEQRYSNNTQQPIGLPYAKADQRVFIIYGDGEFHDDDVRTGPGGTFRFPWLQKGDYRVYVISECGAYDGCNTAVIKVATIGDRKEVVDVGDIVIQNW